MFVVEFEHYQCKDRPQADARARTGIMIRILDSSADAPHVVAEADFPDGNLPDGLYLQSDIPCAVLRLEGCLERAK